MTSTSSKKTRCCEQCKKPVPDGYGVAAELTVDGKTAKKVLYCVDCARQVIESLAQQQQ